SLSPENQAAVQAIRQTYNISVEDEVDALRHTDPHQLWRTIADRIGLTDYLQSGGEVELQRIFQEIDTDGSGSISLPELQEYIQKVDPDIAIAQVTSMLACADRDNDNQVSYEEFQAFFKLLTEQSRS
ncbi:MAG: EF-hand domain-containing protein, partial [Cyanothece sp. SIO2G6]|nr:EF-hand domain-containing protein [Cyanothece sp. SIO2G6]